MKTLSAAVIPVLFVVTALGANQVFAQAGHAGHHRGHAPASPAPIAAQAEATGLSEGTVRRINAEAGSVTIAHGPLANLDMPPMTMSFRMSGQASLEGLAVGDKVRFAAGKDGDEFVVTEIEKAGN